MEDFRFWILDFGLEGLRDAGVWVLSIGILTSYLVLSTRVTQYCRPVAPTFRILHSASASPHPASPPAIGILIRHQPRHAALRLGRVHQPKIAIGHQHLRRAIDRIVFLRMILIAEPQRRPGAVGVSDALPSNQHPRRIAQVLRGNAFTLENGSYSESSPSNAICCHAVMARMA